MRYTGLVIHPSKIVNIPPRTLMQVLTCQLRTITTEDGCLQRITVDRACVYHDSSISSSIFSLCCTPLVALCLFFRHVPHGRQSLPLSHPSQGEVGSSHLTRSLCIFLIVLRVTNLYNMLPVRTAGQFEVLLLVIRYAKEAKLVAMLASFFAGVDEWIKVSFFVGNPVLCYLAS